MYVYVISVAVSAQYELVFREMTHCSPCWFGFLFILTVLGAAMLCGASWIVATAVALFSCSTILTVMTAVFLYREWQQETRVWVSFDIQEPPPVIQGTQDVFGLHVVMGTPVVVSDLRAAARV